MPNQFATAVREYLRAKVERRAPEVTMAKDSKPAPEIINIMAALKESVQAKGRAKVQDAVRKRMGKKESKPSRATPQAKPAARARRSVN